MSSQITMLNYEHLTLAYQPYPIGAILPAMDVDMYNECVHQFPDSELFERLDDVGNKLSLSEKFASRRYREVIQQIPVWREWHRWVKSAEFIQATLDALRQRHVDLGIDSKPAPLLRQATRRLKNLVRSRVRSYSPRLSARFEFSMLPAHGGSVLPHTDNPDKIITVVISMTKDNEWLPEYGGSTDVLQPRDETMTFDHLNDRRPEFEDMDILRRYSFVPNQAIVFVKTFNSWHAVAPMAGPDNGLMRKSLTINIEAR